MTASDDYSRNALPPDEQLVAYLDGELAPEDRRRLEELLASDASVRRRLQDMERTWDLLDDLDTAPVGSQFTQSTLEMVAVAAQQDVDHSLAEAPRRRWHRLLMLTGALLAAGAVGFGGVALLAPDPNQQLLQELPVLEGLDAYRQVDDIAFLRMLQEQQLFSKETREASEPVTPVADESLADRRQRVESMDPGRKKELLRLKERFDSLDRDQQQRLMLLCNAMKSAPDAPELRQIMSRYCEWLKTLPSYTRTELAEAKPADRVKLVQKRLQLEQARDEGRRLSSKDAEALRLWMTDYASRHQEQISKALSDWQKKYLVELPPVKRQSLEFWLMLQRRQATGEDGPLKMLTEDDLQRLRESLSPEPSQLLGSKPLNEQRQLVAEWLRHMARQRSSHGPLPKPNDDRLANFFENVLTGEERDWLLSLPGDEMQQRLQQLYLTRTKPPEGGRHRPEGAPHGRRSGGDRLPPMRPEKNLPPPGVR